MQIWKIRHIIRNKKGKNEIQTRPRALEPKVRSHRMRRRTASSAD